MAKKRKLVAELIEYVFSWEDYDMPGGPARRKRENCSALLFREEGLPSVIFFRDPASGVFRIEQANISKRGRIVFVKGTPWVGGDCTNCKKVEEIADFFKLESLLRELGIESATKLNELVRKYRDFLRLKDHLEVILQGVKRTNY